MKSALVSFLVLWEPIKNKNIFVANRLLWAQREQSPKWIPENEKDKKNIDCGDYKTNMRRIDAMLLTLIVALLPLGNAFDANEDVQFELYTRESRKIYEVLDTHGEPAIAGSRFQATRPTRIFVHGYRSKRKVIDRYSEAFLNAGDYNFIAVNWIEGASTVNYYTAKSRVKEVCNVLIESYCCRWLVDSLIHNFFR